MPSPFSTTEIQQDLTALSASLRDVTVVIRSHTGRRGRSAVGQGSGVLWTPDGQIVTNAHVATTDDATVTFADGRSSEARVVARDRRRDLAVLRADRTPQRAFVPSNAAIGEPSTMRAGEIVVALGHPLGIEHALALGVLHAAPTARSPYVVADIRLAPGNSGGPLADVRGRIVGINSMIVGQLGVAVSVDAVRGLLVSIAPRPTLGVELRPVDVRVPAGAKSPSVGMLVLAIEPDSAAARAGILLGDVLLGFAGHPFRSADQLASVLRDAGPGATLRLDVGRGGRRITCEVQLGAIATPHRRAA